MNLNTFGGSKDMEVKKIKSKVVIALFFSCLLVNLYSFYAPVVSGIVVGDYYICIFDDYAVGTQNISEYVSGDLWLTINSNASGVVGNENKNYSYSYVGDGLGSCWSFYNLSKNTDFISFRTSAGDYTNSHLWFFKQMFRRTNGDQIFKLHIYDDNGANGLIAMKVFDSDNTLLKTTSDLGADAFHDNIWINITFNITTSEINVLWQKGASSYLNYWFAPIVFDYVTISKMDYEASPAINAYFYLDNFTIDGDDSDLPDALWDTGADHSGCSNCDYDGSTSYSFAATDTILLESDYDVFQTGSP